MSSVNYPIIKLGSKGVAVERWQFFLSGLKLYLYSVDGDFGMKTDASTKMFQQSNGLLADGIVGKDTYLIASRYGFMSDIAEKYPKLPDFKPLSSSQRERIFGKIEYIAKPTTTNPEGILITNNWASEHIITINIPQLSKATNGTYTRMSFHKLAANQLTELWAAWERENVLHNVITYGGAFNPRFIRGSRKTLSNHSYGTAFDINMAWNRLGTHPAEYNSRGCVHDLVGIAHEFGFYWGGHFKRKDGMHFEVAKII